MAERIIKETLENGNIQFRIEENTIFGIPTPWWTTKVIECRGNSLEAIFSSLEEARANLEPKRPKVINREIIK